MLYAVRQTIASGGNAVSTVLVFGTGDGGIQVGDHHGAQPTRLGECHPTARGGTKCLPLHVGIGGTNGADGAGHNEVG